MDTKEALKELEDLSVDYGNRNEKRIARLDEAIEMAINALKCSEIPNSSDTISRQTILDALDEIEFEVADGDGFQYAKWRRTTDYRYRGIGFKLNFCPECGRKLTGGSRHE